eukprot:TRINITY_DN6988_c0_g1_i1.p1 TRINITY_DN6988_c0_g1~~TRINITY_DN6988_c0_g1_i1.p1  ORF type:complete len:370 (+),score=84.17 TRINITY_DN6988_c0_g1_i1:30-1112(+)
MFNLELDLDVVDCDDTFVSDTGTWKGSNLKLNSQGVTLVSPKDPALNAFNSESLEGNTSSRGSRYIRPQGAPFIVHYSELKRLEKLGSGAQGCVYRCLHTTTNEVVALKEISLDLSDDSLTKNIEREIRALYKTNCPHIVPSYGAWFREGKVCICLEMMTLGSLDSIICFGRLSDLILKTVAYHVCCALCHLREHHIIHRDIKPSNFLVSDRGEVKVADFGVSAIFETTIKDLNPDYTFVGTVKYMAPEWLCSPHKDYRSDVWSLGISLLELAGERVFCFDNQEITIFDMMKAIMNSPPKADPTLYSEHFCDFISSCLQINIEDRASADQLLQHPWLANVDLQSGHMLLKSLIKDRLKKK